MGVQLPGSPWFLVCLGAGPGPQGVWFPPDPRSAANTLGQRVRRFVIRAIRSQSSGRECPDPKESYRWLDEGARVTGAKR